MPVFEYTNGRTAEMSERYGRILEKLGKGRFVQNVAVAEAPKVAPVVVETRAMEVEDDPEISEVTGKPKRKYKRRDMKAEE